MASCGALMLAAPASGQGKTTICAALARLFRRRGLRVALFKAGPDYLDPQVLGLACEGAALQLDPWMAGEQYCRQMLHEAARVSDLILVEGAMGIYDGQPSSADLAQLFGLPLALVVDVRGMAQTAAAMALGLAGYREGLRVCGLVANRCGSARHRQLIEDSLRGEMRLLASLPREQAFHLPERHLGLVQADEVRGQLDAAIGAAADALEDSPLARLDLDELRCDFPAAQCAAPPPLLDGVRIAVARDAAFGFIYDANLRLLGNMGARLHYFSPLADEAPADCDALWLPGGYPELHAARLARADNTASAIRDLHAAGRPILAECGGMLYCLERLCDHEQSEHHMLGLMPGRAAMSGRSGCQGMQTAIMPGGAVRAHAHHRARSEGTPPPVSHARRQRSDAPGEALYKMGSLTATFLHLFFPSNPGVIAGLFGGAR